MDEIGASISERRAKDIAPFDDREVDYAVVLCAGGVCPFFPWVKEMIHVDFPDPTKVLAAYRRSRDAIAAWIDGWFGGK